MRTRVEASIVAVAAGWAAAMVVTLPMQWIRLRGNVDGGLRPLLYSFSVATGIWIGWTLGIAGGAWLLAGLPAALVLPDLWLLRFRRLFVALSASLAWLVVLIKFKTWKLLVPDHFLSPWLFSLYSLLLVIFAWVAAIVYLRRADTRVQAKHTSR